VGAPQESKRNRSGDQQNTKSANHEGEEKGSRKSKKNGVKATKNKPMRVRVKLKRKRGRYQSEGYCFRRTKKKEKQQKREPRTAGRETIRHRRKRKGRKTFVSVKRCWPRNAAREKVSHLNHKPKKGNFK